MRTGKALLAGMKKLMNGTVATFLLVSVVGACGSETDLATANGIEGSQIVIEENTKAHQNSAAAVNFGKSETDLATTNGIEEGQIVIEENTEVHQNSATAVNLGKDEEVKACSSGSFTQKVVRCSGRTYVDTCTRTCRVTYPCTTTCGAWSCVCFAGDGKYCK